jgi:hypothetical protein
LNKGPDYGYTSGEVDVCCETKIRCDIERNYDYPGNDLQRIENIPSGEACAQLCANEQQCNSWTWGKKDWYTNICWLKTAVKGNRVKDDCCDSGLPCARGQGQVPKGPVQGGGQEVVTANPTEILGDEEVVTAYPTEIAGDGICSMQEANKLGKWLMSCPMFFIGNDPMMNLRACECFSTKKAAEPLIYEDCQEFVNWDGCLVPTKPKTGHKCSPGKNSPGENQGCCTAANPCPKNIGDCDSDDQCQGSLKCNLNKGPEYGYTSGEVDVCCAPPTPPPARLIVMHPRLPKSHKCSPGKNSPGEKQGCCTVADPCPKNVGDCDSDDQCQGSLKCHLDKGPHYGYTSGEVDVCRS